MNVPCEVRVCVARWGRRSAPALHRSAGSGRTFLLFDSFVPLHVGHLDSSGMEEPAPRHLGSAAQGRDEGARRVSLQSRGGGDPVTATSPSQLSERLVTSPHERDHCPATHFGHGPDIC